MAALLRQSAAARRLGGSLLQRAQVEGRRRLVHTDKHVKEELTEKELLGEIQHKKEQLYNAIAKAEQSFLTSTSRNKRLLEHLSVHVNPRPGDSKWRRLRFVRRANNVLDAAGTISLFGVLTIPFVVLFSLKKSVKKRSEDKNVPHQF